MRVAYYQYHSLIAGSEQMNVATIPQFIYGTAWKEYRTQPLTVTALKQGFTAIDTANQRKHYYEEAVGHAIRESGVDRDKLFIQTKYTGIGGQDQRLPYDARQPIATQVAQSFASSLEHIGTTYIDSYVLHGPTQRVGLGDADFQAWAAMEAIFEQKKTHALGVSNVMFDQLKALHKAARIKPVFVQNRCYARTKWDLEIRDFCRENGIHYQAFSLLTANQPELTSGKLGEMAARNKKTIPQLIFRFAIQVGIIPLTGTSSAKHMAEDLAAANFELNADDLGTIENISQYVPK